MANLILNCAVDLFKLKSEHNKIICEISYDITIYYYERNKYTSAWCMYAVNVKGQ